MNHSSDGNGRTLTAVVTDLTRELKEFAETRVEMLKTELGEKLTRLKTAAPLFALGAVLIGTAYLLITPAIIALAGVLVGDTAYRWVFDFLIVAGCGLLWANRHSCC